MAGLLAEQKFHGLEWHLEEDVVRHLRAVRAGEDEGLRPYPSDLRAVALALLDDDPPSQKRRMLLTSRQLLQAKALDIENDLRGTLRNFGLKVGMVSTGTNAALPAASSARTRPSQVA
jgi:hypothetical protein